MEKEEVVIIPGKLYEIGDPERTHGSCIMHDIKTRQHTWIDYGAVVLVLAVREPSTVTSENRLHPDYGIAEILYYEGIYTIDAFFITKRVDET